MLLRITTKHYEYLSKSSIYATMQNISPLHIIRFSVLPCFIYQA